MSNDMKHLHLHGGQREQPIEFVVPDGGQLAKFHRGVGGLHHVAVEVDSLDALPGQFGQRGLISWRPRRCQERVIFSAIFVSPGYTGGVIVEFIQSAPIAEERRNSV